MSAPTKRIFISDVHLGTNRDWDWFRTDRHQAPLLAMIEYARNPDNRIKDLVLLGDVFETWLCPLDESPRTIKQILDANSEVVSALDACTRDPKSPDVYYVNGNHDMHVESSDLAEHLGGVECITQYHSGLLYAEHGSRFAMFNSPDQLHDPLKGLPLGYFITRMLTKSHSYDSMGAMLGFIDDLLEAVFTTEQVAECLIEALAEYTGADLDQPIAMPFDRGPTTLRAVQAKYASLFSRWIQKFGFRYVVNSMRAEGGGLGWFADRLAKKHGYRVVVLGHTHELALDADRHGKRKRIYANSGYWCPGPEESAHFVEVDKSDERYEVAVRRMVDGKPVDVERDSLAR